jgi:segregation and condensation protein A
MAAMLIEIKSRMLLPPKKVEGADEAEDPRAELVRRLIEYEQMKLAAAGLDQLPVLGRDFLRVEVHSDPSLNVRHPDVSLADCAKPGWTSSSAPSCTLITPSPVKSSRCAST